jgi:TATA-box binding protein (TBP) (component of TFIID and TFIIIB)
MSTITEAPYISELNQEWQNFLNNDVLIEKVADNKINAIKKESPICGDLYISTKTKIAYLNTKINLYDVFWKINILDYHIPKEGIIKKQMKFSSISPEELNIINNCVKGEKIVDEHIITQIINPNGRIKYKDVRKISVGLSKKDINSVRSKKKSAFYNCFVVIMRILWKGIFKEIHIKVFNTGKMEIPGIQDDECLFKALNNLTDILRPVCQDDKLKYIKDKIETVLINSNFNCGFYINRDTLFGLLKYEYKINCSYDPCSYPGIQCEFYYNVDQVEPQTGNKLIHKEQMKVSFMIFRTGSVLIVGKCSDEILLEIFQFIKRLLSDKYSEINVGLTSHTKCKKKTKIRKKKLIKLIT